MSDRFIQLSDRFTQLSDRFTQLLHKIPVLKHLTDKEIRFLLEHVDSKIVVYDENQTIIRESEFNNYIYIVLAGKAGRFVNKWITDYEVEISVDELHAGDLIGEIDYLNLSHQSANEYADAIRAIEKSTLFKIDRRLLFNYLKKSNTEYEEDEVLLKDVV